MSRILVVDDEVGLGLVLQDTLELEGHEVSVCNDSASAISELSKNRFDAAILDVFLSDEPEGLALAKHIQAESPETRVVFMTGYAEESDIEDGYVSGVYACIRKPFMLDDVIRVIDIALSKSQS